MNIIQKTPFKKTYKKLHDNQIPMVNDAIKAIIANPGIGEPKKGDLTGVYVYKFDVINQLYLLAYSLKHTKEEDTLILLALGVHENFYNKLKK